MAQRIREIAQDAQIIDGMNVARHYLGDRADACALGGGARQQRRLRPRLVEIFDDRQGLDEDRTVIFERGHEALRLQVEEFRPALLVLAQMPGYLLVAEALEIERDANAERGGRTEIAVKLHERGPLAVAIGNSLNAGRMPSSRPLRSSGTSVHRSGFTKERTSHRSCAMVASLACLRSSPSSRRSRCRRFGPRCDPTTGSAPA